MNIELYQFYVYGFAGQYVGVVQYSRYHT